MSHNSHTSASKKISLAVITARGGSKGLPGKNLAEVGGRSLVRRAVESALDAGRFDRVICSTDSEAIADSARTAGAEIPFMRSAALSADDTPSMAVIFDAIDRVEAAWNCRVEIVGLCEPTTPLRSAEDVRAAFDLLCADDAADAVVSVASAMHAHPAWLQQRTSDGRLQRYFPDLPMPTRRQDFERAGLPRPLMLNGAVYIARTPALRKAGSFLTCPRVLAYEMPEQRSVNIDSAFDLTLARALIAAAELEE